MRTVHSACTFFSHRRKPGEVKNNKKDIGYIDKRNIYEKNLKERVKMIKIRELNHSSNNDELISRGKTCTNRMLR